MRQSVDDRHLRDELSRLLFDGAVTNGIPASDVIRYELERGSLRSEPLPEGILLLRQRGDHQILNFLLVDPSALLRWVPEQTTILELPWRQREPSLSLLGSRLTEQGWLPLLHRVRLSRKGGPLQEAAAVPDAVPAERDDAKILEILRRCFSPLTGCLPAPEELATEEAVLLPGGVLHYRRHGNTTELRHLAVLPEARERGLGRRLIAAYLTREGGTLSRVWTGTDNAAALHLYQSFGYAPDGWNSLVLRSPKG